MLTDSLETTTEGRPKWTTSIEEEKEIWCSSWFSLSIFTFFFVCLRSDIRRKEFAERSTSQVSHEEIISIPCLTSHAKQHHNPIVHLISFFIVFFSLTRKGKWSQTTSTVTQSTVEWMPLLLLLLRCLNRNCHLFLDLTWCCSPVNGWRRKRRIFCKEREEWERERMECVVFHFFREENLYFDVSLTINTRRRNILLGNEGKRKAIKGRGKRRVTRPGISSMTRKEIFCKKETQVKRTFQTNDWETTAVLHWSFSWEAEREGT